MKHFPVLLGAIIVLGLPACASQNGATSTQAGQTAQKTATPTTSNTTTNNASGVAKLQDYLGRITVGMSEAELTAAMGQQPNEITMNATGGQAWTYQMGVNAADRSRKISTTSRIASGLSYFVPGTAGLALSGLGALGNAGAAYAGGKQGELILIKVIMENGAVKDFTGQATNG